MIELFDQLILIVSIAYEKKNSILSYIVQNNIG